VPPVADIFLASDLDPAGDPAIPPGDTDPGERTTWREFELVLAAVYAEMLAFIVPLPAVVILAASVFDKPASANVPVRLPLHATQFEVHVSRRSDWPI
jgi:hypothetical protein